MELVYTARNRLEFLDLKASEKIARVAGGLFGDRGKKKWENAREAAGRTVVRAGTRSSLSLSPNKPQATKAKNVCIETQVIILSKTLTFISKLFWVEQNLGDFVVNGGVGRSQMIIPNTEVFARKPVNGVPRKKSVQFLLSYAFNILTTMQAKSVGTFTRHRLSKTGYLPHFTPKQRWISSKIDANKFLFPAKHCLRKLGDQGMNLKPIQTLLSNLRVCVPYITWKGFSSCPSIADPELPN